MIKKNERRHPPIYLKGINFPELNTKYRAGSFATLTFPNVRVTLESTDRPSNILVPGEDPRNDDIFVIRSNCGSSIKYATTNCEAFKITNLKGEEVKGGKCTWCRKKIRYGRFGLVLGFFYGEDKLLYVHLEGPVCGFECSRSEARLLALDPELRERYKDCEDNVLKLFKIMFPGEELNYAPFYRLFTTCEGSIDPDSLITHTFTPTPDIVVNQAKGVFKMQRIIKVDDTKEKKSKKEK